MFKEYFIYIADILPLTQSANGNAFQDFTIKIASDSHFEMVSTIFQATDNRLNMKIINASSGEEIVKSGDARAVSSAAFSGISANGFRPYNFPMPYMIPADSELLIQAADKSNGGSGNNFRLAVHGNKIYDGKSPYADKLRRRFYSFQLDSGALAANDSTTVTFRMETGFLVSKLTGVSTGAGLCFLQDVRPWMSQECHFYNLVGNSQFGNNLTSQRWIPPKTVLTARFTDLSGLANRFKITFHGELVF